uniref:CSON014112 protein n=1 Tax=Culicoides sonorensis TaxID=179676 RepID=A0A336LN78_CULSO
MFAFPQQISLVFLSSFILTQGQLTVEPVSETRTVCKITSGDVEATAEATISRNIEGVCTNDDMMNRFYELELRLVQELYSIRHMIAQALHQDPNFYVPLPSYLYPVKPTPRPIKLISTTPAPVYITPLPEVGMGATNDVSKTDNDAILFPKEESEEDDDETHSGLKKIPQVIQLKQLKPPRKSNTLIRSRDSEIHTFNNTMLKAGDAKIFTYFWRLENFTSRLLDGEHTLNSPIFTISDLNLRIVATINYMGRDFLNLRIEQVSDEFVKSHKKSVVSLETGKLFQKIEVKKQFKHKIIIIDQGTPATDLISQDFMDTTSGFQIPTNTITGTRYVKNDTVLIRVVIYI